MELEVVADHAPLPRARVRDDSGINLLIGGIAPMDRADARIVQEAARVGWVTMPQPVLAARVNCSTWEQGLRRCAEVSSR